MNIHRVVACSTVAALFLSVPATAQQLGKPNPINFPGSPWGFWGFVVNVPNSLDLYSLSKTSAGMVIVKKLAEPDHTYAFTAGIEKPDKAVSNLNELSEYIKQGERKTESARFREVSFEEEHSEHAGAPCTRYARLSEDLGVRVGQSVPLVTHGMTCLHPLQRGLLVTVAYSERAGGKAAGAELTGMGQSFLRSLRFIPLPPHVAPGRPEIQNAFEAMKARNGDRALEILNPLLERDDSQAAALAGEIHVIGYGNEKNFAAGRKMYILAAKDGTASVLHNLGIMYERGEGVPPDPVEALRWLKHAADQRYPAAQYELGRIYQIGEGVAPDKIEGEKWMRMAADNGHDLARKALRRR
jgi:TPR repeat protein